MVAAEPGAPNFNVLDRLSQAPPKDHGDGQPLQTHRRLNAIALLPRLLFKLNIVQQNKGIHLVDQIEVTQPGQYVGWQMATFMVWLSDQWLEPGVQTLSEIPGISTVQRPPGSLPLLPVGVWMEMLSTTPGSPLAHRLGRCPSVFGLDNVEFVNGPCLARQESVFFNPVKDKACSESVHYNPAE